MNDQIKRNNRAVAIFAGCLALVVLEKRFHLGFIAIAAGAAAGVLVYIILNKVHK